LRRTVTEAIASVAARRARFATSVTVIALCLASAIAIAGLASSGRAQARLVSIAELPTRVEVEVVTATDDSTASPITSLELRRAQGLANATGVLALRTGGTARVGMADEPTGPVDVVDVAGDLRVSGAVFRSGNGSVPVAVVLSNFVAKRLGMTDLDGGSLHLIVDGRPTLVSGILAPEGTVAGIGTSIVLVHDLSEPRTWDSITIAVRRGAADVVADIAALAIRPDAPEDLAASVDDDTSTRSIDSVLAVLTSMSSLVSHGALVATGLAIAGVATLSVAQRRDEFGLRRAVGASRVDVGGQVVLELAVTAGLSGLLAIPLAVGVVLTVNRVVGWVDAVELGALLRVPALAVAIACVTGVVPAWRAASTSPALAMREL